MDCLTIYILENGCRHLDKKFCIITIMGIFMPLLDNNSSGMTGNKEVRYATKVPSWIRTKEVAVCDRRLNP